MAHKLLDFMPREAEKVFAGLTDEELETAEHIFQTIRKNIDAKQI